MSPRSYHPDRAASSAERKRRYDARRRAEASSLERIDQAPSTRQQRFDGAALQQRPMQFDDTWGKEGRLAKQHEREDVDWGRHYDGYGPDLAANVWVPTRKSGLRRSKRLQAAREMSPVQVIPVTQDLERQALADIARIQARQARGRRKRR